MIKRLLDKLLSPPPRVRHQVHAAADLGIDLDLVDRSAYRTVETLKARGFEAYIVGGAVRDLILGATPKDFDVATNATPEQVKPLFRRAFIIGRRFKLVHVMQGADTIEVSTYRGPAGDAGRADEHGRILSDNVYGTHQEDAVRRDFTVNALYYDPVDGKVHDFVGGVKDLRAKTLRLIGDPVTRYREDPVRMLRAIRLSAKLGLKLARTTTSPIKTLGSLIQNVPAARLFDEMQKLLLSGHAVTTLAALRAHGLHHGLLPLLDVILEQPQGQRFVQAALTSTDDRVREGKPVSPVFLFATLLWHEVLTEWERRKAAGEHVIPALNEAADMVLDQQAERIAIPRRFAGSIRDIWLLQPRFEQRTSTSAIRLLEQERFRAGFDFLLLRAEANECPAELGEWWTDLQEAGSAQREAMVRQQREAANKTGVPSAKRKRRPRKAPDASASEGAEAGSA